MSTSPKAAASRGVPARALGPRLAASYLSCSRLREENITSCPAFTQTAPSAPPTLPEPTMPIFIFPAAVRAARAVSGRPSSAAAAAMIPRNRRRSRFMSIYYNRGIHLHVHDTIDLPRRGHSPRGPAVRRTARKRGGARQTRRNGTGLAGCSFQSRNSKWARSLALLVWAFVGSSYGFALLH